MTFSPNLAIPVSVKDAELRQVLAAVHDILSRYATAINDASTAPIAFVGVPLHSTSTGTTGQIAVDASFLYVCTATNTWARIAWTSTTW